MSEHAQRGDFDRPPAPGPGFRDQLAVMTPDDRCTCGHARWAHASEMGCLVVSGDPDGPYDDDCQRFHPSKEQ